MYQIQRKYGNQYGNTHEYVQKVFGQDWNGT